MKWYNKIGAMIVSIFMYGMAVVWLDSPISFHNKLLDSPIALNNKTLDSHIVLNNKTLDSSIALNNKEFLDSKNEKCEFYTTEQNGAIPIILMSLGRSGSSVTWDTISKMTGEASAMYEWTGQTMEQSKLFFDSINPKVGSQWAREHLCQIQKSRSKDAGVVAFQWKPYFKTINHPYAISALKDIGSSTSPLIRIIFLTRNPIDRQISNLRHVQSEKLKKSEAHCLVNDEECLRKHKESIKDGVALMVGTPLLKSLEANRRNNKQLEDQLTKYNVQYLHVSYENLYGSENANEWMKIFAFLGKGPTKGLTMDEVRGNFTYAATTSVSREASILNFNRVREDLRGTDFYDLLYE